MEEILSIRELSLHVDDLDRPASAIDPGEREAWRALPARRNIAVEAASDWRRGGRSICFRDPDATVAEGDRWRRVGGGTQP